MVIKHNITCRLQRRNGDTMLTSKQRAQLRGMANSIDTIFQIGKGGINEQLIKQVDDTIEVRELIKLRVLESSPQSSKQAADEIAKQTESEVVQIIGSKFILYRRCSEKEKRKITFVR